MTATLQRLVALWAALLATMVCFGFLPVSATAGAAILSAALAVILAALLHAARRRKQAVASSFDGLPQADYRQPVVLCVGDDSGPWPDNSNVLTVAEGCRVRVSQPRDLQRIVRQLLLLRPDWGQQLAVLVSVCPQCHQDIAELQSQLHGLRWQLAQLRRKTRQPLPLLLSTRVAGAFAATTTLLWLSEQPGEAAQVWQDGAAPCSATEWLRTGGTQAASQLLILNALQTWFSRHVQDAFVAAHPDVPAVAPVMVLNGLSSHMTAVTPDSCWLHWLRQHTALQQVAGWQPAAAGGREGSACPDILLPLLPQGRGITPQQRAGRLALWLFTAAAIVALCSSGWNNRQLLKRVAFDIGHYQRIAMDDYAPKSAAMAVLRGDAAELDAMARNGEPLRLGLGLYQGARLHQQLFDTIRDYVPPPQPATLSSPEENTAPQTIRLDSMALFDSGKSALRPGSTKVLIGALVGIKAKPGWLIVVSGHTDNTGSKALNQTLSQKRAEAVRDWMRDTGDVPESCFAVQGVGDSRPVALNGTAEGRATNRRVEISLVPQANACQIPAPPAPSQDDDAL